MTYGNICAEFYDLDKPLPPAEAFEMLLRYAREAGGPVLELMSGTGRYLLPLIEAGIDIEGADASPSMAARCKTKAAERGLNLRLFEGPLSRMEFESRFAFAFIADSSFGLVAEPGEARASLDRIHRALQPGGKLLIGYDRCSGSGASSWPWGGRWIKRPDGVLLIISWMGHYDPETQVESSLHRYERVQDGRIVESEIEEFSLRTYSDAQFRDLLEGAGFRVERALKAYGEEPPTDGEKEVLLLASKPTG